MTAQTGKISIIGSPCPEALTLLNHFATTYPLPYRAIVNFLRRNGLRFMGVECINGKAWFVDHIVPGAKRFELRVCLGAKATPRPLEQVLRTLCHEYKHALQFATGVPADCKEAERFALNELSRYLTRTTGVPYALPCSLVPNFVPPIPHLREILHHLAVNHPLYKAVHVDYVRRIAPTSPRNGCRKLRPFALEEPFGFRVAIGTKERPRPGSEVIHATLHGYLHVIQQSKGSPLDCDEADRFVLKILEESGGGLSSNEVTTTCDNEEYLGVS